MQVESRSGASLLDRLKPAEKYRMGTQVSSVIAGADGSIYKALATILPHIAFRDIGLRLSFLAVSLLVVVATGIAAGCSPDPYEAAAPLQGTAIGIDVDAMDKAIPPGDDFYLYANGNWLKNASIPPDHPAAGATTEARDATRRRLDEIVASVTASPQKPGSDGALIAAYYSAYVDMKAIDAAGLEPVRMDLERFDAIRDRADLSHVLGQQLRADVDPLNATDLLTENLFGVFVTKALGEETVTPYLLQGGLGMPGRDFYLSDDPLMKGVRRAYRDYVAQVFTLAEMDKPSSRAAAVIALETRIAQAHVPRERTLDFAASATVWPRERFALDAPGIDWNAFFAGAELDQANRISAYHAPAIVRLSALVASEPLGAWKDWLTFHQINSHADVLPALFADAHFRFYGRRLAGARQAPGRETQAVDALSARFGESLGALYAVRYFPEEQRRDVAIMADRIKDAFSVRLEAAQWLSAEARSEALAKLHSMIVGIGYPNSGAARTSWKIARGSAYAMTVAAETAHYDDQLAKLGPAMNREEWWTGAHVAQALYLPVQNAINVPAALLQPPFYDPEADAAANYGAIGAVIGREIAHGFDTLGVNFDSGGMLRTWWSEEDRAEFDGRAEVLVGQYADFSTSAAGVADGRSTLAENIADLAGIAAAYDAYRASLDGKEPRVIDGFTGDQRFFIAYAQIWASKMRDTELRDRLASDRNAPARFRGLTVRNLDAWYRAFDVPEDAKLYLDPEKRVRVW